MNSGIKKRFTNYVLELFTLHLRCTTSLIKCAIPCAEYAKVYTRNWPLIYMFDILKLYWLELAALVRVVANDIGVGDVARGPHVFHFATQCSSGICKSLQPVWLKRKANNLNF